MRVYVIPFLLVAMFWMQGWRRPRRKQHTWGLHRSRHKKDPTAQRQGQANDMRSNPYSAYKQTAKLSNTLIKAGKKDVAEKIIRRACALWRASGQSGPLIHQAILNVTPLIELRKPAQGRRGGRGGVEKQKVVPILPGRAEKLAIEWIIQGAKRRKGSERTMSLCIYLELLNASQKKGYAFSKKQELHGQCQISSAFQGPSSQFSSS